uniref:F-box domain-containing protein n=1 Tax=Myotis lucifugus TaxID=59463 RepID=G1Q0T9_MYOLU
CACLCGLGSSRGCLCPKECQGPAEGKPAPAEKHLEADAAARGCAGSGGIESPMPPQHCLLQDLPVEMLVDIFASLPGTDLASLAQACTKFRDILHTDSIWRQRCHREFGVPGNLQKPETIGGMSYREVYAKMFPYRNLLGLWQLNYGYRRLLNVVVDLMITGWMYVPRLNTHVDGPMQFEPSFRIHLMQRKSATVEYMLFPQAPHADSVGQVQHPVDPERPPTDSPTRLRGEQGLEMSQEDRQLYDHLTYRRLYLPPSHQGDLIRPGLFQGKSDGVGLMIAMLSFHGKYARVTKITGDNLDVRDPPHDGETFRNFNELSRVIQEIEEQVICEQQQQQQQQQQQENRTEESEGHGWQSPVQPSVREFWAAPSEEQPVPFVIPVGVRSGDQNYPRTCRMCFYGVHIDTLHGSAYPRRCPGVFILFDEHFGFIWLEMKYFILNTFQHVEAPSPQAFREMLSNIQPGSP